MNPITKVFIYSSSMLLGSDWQEITNYVVSSIESKSGFSGISPNDRVASTGTMKFALNNADGLFFPANDLIYGLKYGQKVNLQVTWRETITKFYGFITDIEVLTKERRVNVTVSDWMEYSSRYSITLPTLQYDKTIPETVDLILASMPVAPLNKVYYLPSETFPTVFDAINTKTKALSEFNKLALSEYCYIYLRKDKTYGETFVVEGRHDPRDLNDRVDTVPILADEYLLMEDGSYLLCETGKLINLNQEQELIFNNDMLDIDITNGENVINTVYTKAYPRKYDTSNVVLLTLNNPIPLSAGETKSKLRFSYRDSTGNSRITAKDLLAPVAGTDYKFTQNSDGSGTDLTANLSVSVTYGAEGAEYTLTNNGVSGGFVSILQARGKGIYFSDPVSYVTSDSTSIATYGDSSVSIDMKYLNSPTTASQIADVVLGQEKEPKTEIKSIRFIANDSDLHMSAFLYGDLGDLVNVIDDDTGINSYFYIHGISYSISPGGIIYYSYLLKEALTLNSSYWVLEQAGLSELGVTTITSY